METGPYSNLSALDAISRRFEALTQDVANAASPGYRRRVAANGAFEGALGRLERVGAELEVDAEPGPVQTTNEPLDVALAGPGYFTVQDPQAPDGPPLLTRRGDLTVADGALHLRGGPPVLGDGGPIQVPDGAEVHVAGDGAVVANGEVVGRLQVVSGEQLSPRGGGLYAAKTTSPLASPRVVAGAREGSNVRLPEAMAELVLAQRLYSANLGAMRQRDGIDQRLLQIRHI